MLSIKHNTEMSNFNKIQIDYDLFSTMRHLCLEVVRQAEMIGDIDEDGDYRIEPYGGGIMTISEEEMQQLKLLNDM